MKALLKNSLFFLKLITCMVIVQPAKVDFIRSSLLQHIVGRNIDTFHLITKRFKHKK